MIKEERSVKRLLEALNQGLFEKEYVLALTLLAAVAGESIFLLGRPGVAKSMIARRLKLAFKDAQAFEYLMTRFSTPDEIFGPVSIAGLKNADRYERLTEGYLPSADVVFLDEIWKAGSSIQNALLTILNEKLYRNGNYNMQLPLKVVIAASNELPATGEGLEALWDRFLIRVVVNSISSEDAFRQMLLSDAINPDIPEDLLLTKDKLETWKEECNKVEADAFVFDWLYKLRVLLAQHSKNSNLSDEEELYVSDRRWKKFFNLLRCSAFLNARMRIELVDTTLAINVLWDNPSQKSDLKTILVLSYSQAIEEHFRYTLLAERLHALREMMHEQHFSGRSNESAFKVLSSFFYQITASNRNNQLLIYISEYQKLRKGISETFILTSDRRKAGVQILRRFERSRHVGAIPKDLYQVSRCNSGVIINGKEYPFVVKDGESILMQEETQTIDSCEMQEVIKRIESEVGVLNENFDTWCKQQEEMMQQHLFMNQEQKDCIYQAYDSFGKKTKQLQIEINELKAL